MFSKDIYINRRKQLKGMVKEGIIVIFGNNETPMNYAGNPFRFIQDASFLYFFGIDKPGLTGIIDIDNDEEILFGHEPGMDDFIWTGFMPSIRELADKSGVSKSSPIEDLEHYFRRGLIQKRRIHFLPPYSFDHKYMLTRYLELDCSECEKFASIELINAIVQLRSVKEDYEVKEIEDTLSGVTYDMFTSAMKSAKEGIFEREIAGLIEGISLQRSGPLAYPPIVTVHGEILHNHYYGNELKDGQMMLIDAGASSPEHYATDISRTFPVSGKFTGIQKELYNIVLTAQLTSIESMKPGVYYYDIHMNASKIIAEGLKSMKIMQGDVEEAVEVGAHALFIPHGLGHMMGLQVHDMEDMGEDNVGYDDNISRSKQFGTASLRMAKKLQKGHVITVEPGLYFIPILIKQWKSEKRHEAFINYTELEKYMNTGGIRIEDDVLITDTGNRILGKPIPKTIKELEQMMKG